MSKTYLILVSDSQQNIDTARKYWETHDVEFQVYTPEQWKSNLENPTFRQQLGSQLPTLSAGLGSVSPVPVGGNVLAFPTPSVDSRVQKMDDIEAKAIENAISQYKGNLTEAAKALGIGRATLYRKVKQYQIDPSQARRKKMAQAA